MKDSTALTITLVGYLAIAPFLQSPLSADPPKQQIIKHNTEQTKPLTRDEKEKEKEKEKFARYPRYIETNYYSILKHIQEANKDYVDKARRVSSDLENSIKKYGIKETVNMRNKAHSFCLDLALERITQKMPRKEFDKKTKQISKQYYENIQKTNVSAPIDFKRELIIQACQKKLSLDVLFYERLLTSKRKANPKETNPIPDYKEWVKSAFSEKEYSEVISKRLSAIDGIYDAFLKSRVGFKGLFATGSINKMRAFAKQYYKEEAEKIYPTKAGGKVLKKNETRS